jgi:ABC-type lipoprotein export system ATPase subunit
MDILEALWCAGTTVVVVTHDREMSARAPRTIEMRDGRIVRDVRASAASVPRPSDAAYADAD